MSHVTFVPRLWLIHVPDERGLLPLARLTFFGALEAKFPPKKNPHPAFAAELSIY